jgi:hypothetical protein
MDYSAEIQCLLLAAGGALPQGVLRKKITESVLARDERFDKDAYLGALDVLIHLKRIEPSQGRWTLRRRVQS